MAAHPQQEDVAGPVKAMAKNPFPTQMTVPGPDGKDVGIDLAVVAGTLYAPNLDNYELDPDIRQYVTAYCASWSGSVMTAEKIQRQVQERPRRVQVVMEESQLHAMLGLAADERLLRVVADQLTGSLRFIVESPRLPQQPYWNGDPPYARLPIAACYENPAAA